MKVNKIIMALVVVAVKTGILQAQAPNDVLLKVNNRPVTVEEFKYIYEKNNGKEANYSEKSLQEYLELYTKFKLKVERAKSLKLDTIQSLQDELAGYKRQLANSYLTEKEIVNHLMEELSERQNQDVRIKHLLISLPERASDSVKNVAFDLIKKIEVEINKGKSFEAAVKQYSQDGLSKEKDGDIGYLTAMLPEGFYDLENAMYTLGVGKVSGPIKTRLGYHLIKISDKRPAKGLVSIAHILVKTASTRSDDAKQKIEAAHKRVLAGEDFSKVVSEVSEDFQSNKSNGYLPVFGINTYEPVFEEAAFALSNEGDISPIIQTKSGYHILKLIKKSKANESNPTLKKQTEARIKKDDRFAISRRRLVQDIKNSSGYKENRDVLNKFMSSLNDEFLSFKWAPELSSIGMKDAAFVFGGDTKFTVSDFASFCKKNTKTRLKYEKNPNAVKQAAEELIAEFSEEKAIDYEQKQLEVKYPEFKALMREYEEGILLFEASKRAVWDKANQDTSGLDGFYHKNKERYKTDEKGNLLTYNIATNDMKRAEKIRKMAAKKSPEEVVKKFNKKNDESLTFTEETMEKINPRFKDIPWKLNTPGMLSKNEANGGFTFAMTSKIFPSRPKTLKEARGYVVADYQEYLERRWIEELTKAYNVEINQDVLQKMIKR